MTLEPFGEWVLVEKANQLESTTIVIPERHCQKSDRGTVLAIGRGRRTDQGHVEPPAFEPGDSVAFPRFAGHDFKVEGQSVLLIKESDILAILH